MLLQTLIFNHVDVLDFPFCKAEKVERGRQPRRGQRQRGRKGLGGANYINYTISKFQVLVRRDI